ncbi:MAG: endo-1,4-beta-xylanase, partial [Anaerolineaceae bacterium]|nr:endo-1,4-beta-xylanase [Anaerolineaceae bacterium]
DLSNVQGSNEERFAKQAKIYGDVLTACINSKVCNSFTVWEIVDKYSWLEQNLGKPNADATLFDDNMQPKPAYFAIKDILEKYAGGW